MKIKNVKKMNKLYLAALILLAVGAAAFIASIAIVYGINKTRTGAICAGAGALCCFVGIILAVKSAPKKPKAEKKTVNPPDEPGANGDELEL